MDYRILFSCRVLPLIVPLSLQMPSSYLFRFFHVLVASCAHFILFLQINSIRQSLIFHQQYLIMGGYSSAARRRSGPMTVRMWPKGIRMLHQTRKYSQHLK